jgi:hypothetical protein
MLVFVACAGLVFAQDKPKVVPVPDVPAQAPVLT